MGAALLTHRCLLVALLAARVYAEVGACSASADGTSPDVCASAEEPMSVDVVEGLGASTAAKIHEYRQLNKPLLVRLQVSDWASSEFTSLKSARKWLRHKSIKIARSSEIIFNGGNGVGPDRTVGAFTSKPLFREERRLNEEPPYMFQRKILDDKELHQLFPAIRSASGPLRNESLQEHGPPANLDPPDTLREFNWADTILMLGAKGSGAGIHEHDEAASGLLVGEKHWVLWPNRNTPIGGIPSDHYISQWFRSIRPQEPASRRYEVKQQPGDILYVPEGYFHGVLNLKDSLGIAFQRSTPRPLENTTSIKKVFLSKEVTTQEKKRQMKAAFAMGTSEAAHILSSLYADEGDLKTAMEWEWKALELDPTYLTAHSQLGVFMAKAGKATDGYEHLRKAQSDGTIGGNFSVNLLAEAIKTITEFPIEGPIDLDAASVALTNARSFASDTYISQCEQLRSPLFHGFLAASSANEWLYFDPRVSRGPDKDALVLLFAAARDLGGPLEVAVSGALKVLTPLMRKKKKFIMGLRADSDPYGLSWAADFEASQSDFPFVGVLKFGARQDQDQLARHHGSHDDVEKFLRDVLEHR